MCPWVWLFTGVGCQVDLVRKLSWYHSFPTKGFQYHLHLSIKVLSNAQGLPIRSSSNHQLRKMRISLHSLVKIIYKGLQNQGGDNTTPNA